ncbi:MAG: DUF4276 family protein [Candidatus Eremiobacterota bacterium]
MLDYLIVAEGPSEVGSTWEDDRNGFLGELLPRCLKRLEIDANLECVPLRRIKQHGKGLAGKVRGAVARAEAEGKDGLLLFADRDRDSQRPRDLEEGRKRARLDSLAIRCALGCPKETLEAWVLGDGSSLRGILPSANVHPNPESLNGKPGTARHPKTVFQGLLGATPARDVFERAGRAHDLDTLAMSCQSFKAFLDDLNAEFGG